MSIYGEFDVRFRPRPAMWRIALTSLAQILIAAVIAALLLGVCDMLVLRSSGMRRAWLIHGAPWQRIGIERGVSTSVGAGASPARRPERPPPHYLAAGALVVAMLIYFWPFAPALPRRMFAMSVVQMMMLFTVWPIVIAASVQIAAAVLLVAIFFVVRAEGSIANDLANVIDLQHPGRRVLLWLIRIVPAASLLGALAYRNKYAEGWIAAIAFAALTFFVAVARRPPVRYEKLEGVELREAAAATPIVAALLLAAAVFLFGCYPIVFERRVIVVGPELSIVSREELRARLPD